MTTLNPEQYPPTWGIWGMSAGRGAGKSRAAIEYFNQQMIAHPGWRGFIVIPKSDDIEYTVEHFQRVNPDITYSPSLRRLTWHAPEERLHLAVVQAQEILARVQDLPESSTVRRAAKEALRKAELEKVTGVSTALITGSDWDNTARGVQSHISLIEDAEDHKVWEIGEYGSGYSGLDNVRLATRLGLNPQIIITHLPSFEKPWPKETIYTMDYGILPDTTSAD